MTPKEAQHRAHYCPSAPTHETDELLCDYCQVWSPLSKWKEEVVDCETCGWSEVMACPECLEVNGSVHTHDAPIDVRPAAIGEGMAP